MKLSEIFTQLTHGELSQVSLGGAAAGSISEVNYGLVVSHINLALTALHKRFTLKEGRQLITLVPGIYTYPLANDVLKVISVFTVEGTPVGLNDEGNTLACSTPSASLLRVPVAIVDSPSTVHPLLQTTALEVVFRQNHPMIEVGDFGIDPTQVEVDLPYTHLEPLLLYVAARVHAPGDLSGQPITSNSYLSRYEVSCREIENQGLQVEQGGQHDRLRRTGWI